MAIDEVAQARVDVWKFAYSFVYTDVLKTVVELEIADVLEKNGGSMPLPELSAAVGCASDDSLHRILRFLSHHGMFRTTKNHDLSTITYSQTALSRLLMKGELAPFILLANSAPQGPYNGICAAALRSGEAIGFAASSGEDVWSDEAHGRQNKVFTDAMECHARYATATIIRDCPEAFEGIGTLVDVGGRHGLALSMLVKAFPWLRGINFDLPPVVADAPSHDGIVHVGGSMLESVPKADAVMMMRILHDWGDDLCIDILRNSKKAVASDGGRVIIVDAVIYEDGEGDEFDGARLGLDMVMMNVTVKGRERTVREWQHILKEAGFVKHTIKNLPTIESLIVAYP